MFRKIIKNNVIKKQVRMISSNRFFNEENLALKNMMTSFVSKEKLNHKPILIIEQKHSIKNYLKKLVI